MFISPHPARRRRVLVLATAAVVGATALAACGSGEDVAAPGAGASGAAGSAGSGGITVWVDASRAPAAEAFLAANPDADVEVVSYDGSANGSDTFKTRMNLYDQAGEGWPDVVFSTQNNDASWASQATPGNEPFAAVLDDGLVDPEVLEGFTEGSLDPCTVEGQVYCLRNDLAQVVLWYDQQLMDDLGYEVPTTWEEYVELSGRVAAENPGVITGSVGDAWTPEVFMWGSRCPANQVTGPRSISVDATAAECVRAAEVIDAGVADGSLTTLSVFAPEFVQEYSEKVLMMPGPAWFAGAIFNNPDSLALPEGRLGVAAPLPWEGEEAVTGNVGGGTWFVSSHSENPELAADFVEFVTTDDAYQVEQAPGYPAYAPAAEKWLAQQEESGYYATDLSALTEAGSVIWDGWGAPAFSQEAVWADTMTPLVTAGGSVVDNLDTWGEAIRNEAQVNGYTVE
ncbi:ABC transporter substrate-binding protein [Aquipuribacter sp. SD81]|uniref:ABC transporter substrate-binding protein n=1 Tax=Aquipuribacter sp. SD81 TaxID=3127703 RepID=UPI00301A0CAC